VEGEVGAVNEKSGLRVVGQRGRLGKWKSSGDRLPTTTTTGFTRRQNSNGEDFAKKVQNAFLKLDSRVPEQRKFSNFGGKQIYPHKTNHSNIEAIGREIGKSSNR